MREIERHVNDHRQGKDMLALYETPPLGPPLTGSPRGRVRFRVHLDTSYPYQSYAVAELFDGQRWNEVATAHYDEFTGDELGTWAVMLDAARMILERRVCWVRGDEVDEDAS